MKTVNGIGHETNLTELTLSHEASGLVGQYKDIIREQDYKLQTLQDTMKQAHTDIENLKRQLAEAQQTNTQLFDQNILLKAQLSAATGSGHQHSQTVQNYLPNSIKSDSCLSDEDRKQMTNLKEDNKRLMDEVMLLNSKLNEALEMTEQSLNLTEIGRMRKDQEDLLELLTDQV